MKVGEDVENTVEKELGILNYGEIIEKMSAILKEKGINEEQIQELIKNLYQ